MSIFPKHLRPGATITIHTRLECPVLDRPAAPLVELAVRDPLGRVTVVARKHVLLVPDDDGAGVARTCPPALVVLSEAARVCGDAVSLDRIAALRRGTHLFTTLALPEDATLGSYSVELRAEIEGRILHSDTRAEDRFFVEDLHVVARAGTWADVLNPSPVAVQALLLEVERSDAAPPWRRTAIELRPGAVTRIATASAAAYLFYGSHDVLALRSAEPVVVRNPRLRSRRAPGTSRPADGPRAALWHAAIGVFSRDVLRSGAAIDAYDTMVASGLLHEVDIDPPWSRPQAESSFAAAISARVAARRSRGPARSSRGRRSTRVRARIRGSAAT